SQGESQPLHRQHVNSGDSCELREVASQFVSDLIYRAKETPPEIQIDLVGSRTPSPEEEVTYVAPEPNFKKKKVILQDDPSEEDSESASEVSGD
ncbi:unnamed protein product, partial [Ixodes hexagonus]